MWDNTKKVLNSSKTQPIPTKPRPSTAREIKQLAKQQTTQQSTNQAIWSNTTGGQVTITGGNMGGTYYTQAPASPNPYPYTYMDPADNRQITALDRETFVVRDLSTGDVQLIRQSTPPTEEDTVRTKITFEMEFYPENDEQVRAFMHKFAEAKDNIEAIGIMMPFYKNKPASFDLWSYDLKNKTRRFNLDTGEFITSED